MIAYTVTCEFDDEKARATWMRWLVLEHIAEVCAAGAVDAEVIQLDGAPPACEARYHFATREDFDVYVKLHAPRLRAKGLERAPKDSAVRFRRTLGEVVKKK
jgi:hypothetical protein